MQGTLKRMYSGEISPLEAVNLLDQEIGGIITINARQGITLQNHVQRVSIKTEGLKKKQEKFLEEFATLAYWKAQQNGSITPGELHLGKGLSSKHYARELRDYTQNLLVKYG